MELGYIAKEALRRAELPVDDGAHLDLARGYVNDSIQDLWYLCDADWKTSSSSFVTVNGSDTYILNKYFEGIVKDSMRGVTIYKRVIHWVEQERFFRITQSSPTSTGNPIIATFGDYYGIDEQLNVPSQMVVYSSLANKTVGNVKVIAQSKTITGTGTMFNKNDIGLRIKITGDTKSYVIDDVQGQVLTLEEKYEGASQDSVGYILGDIDVHVNVRGYVAGAVDSEDIELNGATHVTGQKVFTTLLSVSKSSLTGGKTIVQSTGGQVVATLDPTEMEIERRSVRLWRIPGSIETIQYRFFMRHPILRVDSDRPLIPEKYHRLICYLTERKLREWADRNVPNGLLSDIAEGKEKYVNDAQNTSQGSIIPNPEGIVNGFNDYWNPYIDQDFTVREYW